MKLEIFLLGPFNVTLNGHPLTSFESDKVRALLAYLAAEANQPHRRSSLAGLLWPELTEQTARKNLRQALFNLRKVIADAQAEPPFLTITRQTIQLNPDGNCWLDVTAFTQPLDPLSHNGDTLRERDVASVQQALQLYQQEFMAGFSLEGSAAFESWLLLKREYLRRLALNGFDALISHHYQAENYPTALQIAQQRLTLDSWHEATHRQIMELLALTGQHQAALAQYERCCQQLREALNVEPSPETAALYARLQAEQSRGDDGGPARLVNPYKGLRAFQEADSADFFGRDGFTAQLLQRLDTAETAPWEGRFLAVVGSSGSGKSSAVRAGLLPTLRQRAEAWQILEMVPSVDPIIELGLALQPVTESLTDVAVESQLHADGHGLQQLLQPVTAPILLFIDQFEELFTLVSTAKTRTHFLDLLLTALQAPNATLHVVITLRADFYDHALHYPDFGRLLNQQAELIFPLTTEELAQAITKPAERVGVRLEAGLVAAIVADVSDQPGMLPLLQYALTELFEQRQGRQLTLAAYRAIGGVSGALSRRADELYIGLTEPAQQAVRQLFLRLVTVGEGMSDARRRVPRLELLQVANNATKVKNNVLADAHQTASPSTRLIETVLDNFNRYRLLTFDQDPALGSPTVEIAHEALIEKWSRLQTWLQRSREDVLTHRRLLALAEEWAQADQDPEFLASGSRLTQFEAWAANTDLALTLLERAYLEACLTARQARHRAQVNRQAHEMALQQQAKGRLQMLVTVLMIATLLASSLAIFALSQRNRAEQQTRLTTSRQLAAQAVNLMERQYDLALLLSVQANAIEQTIEAESSLLTLLQTNPHLITYLQGHPAGVNDLDLSPDGRLLASAGGQGHLQLWDTASWQAASPPLPDPNQDIWTALFTPDSQRLISGGTSGWLTIWNVADGQPLSEPLSVPTGNVVDATLNPTGTELTIAIEDNRFVRWDLTAQRWLEPLLLEQDNFPYRVQYSPDGRLLAAVGESEGLFLWNIDREQLADEPLAVGELITSFAFSPQGDDLAVGNDSGTIGIWTVQTGRLTVGPIHIGANFVNSLAYSPDGRWLVSGNGDGRIQLWDAATLQPHSPSWQGHAQAVWDKLFTLDGQQMVTAAVDGSMVVWDMAHRFSTDEPTNLRPSRLGQRLVEPQAEAVWSQLTADGQWLGTILLDGQVQIVPLITTSNGLTLTEQWLPAVETDFTDLTLNVDGSRIATGYDIGQIRVWDRTENELQLTRVLTMPDSAQGLSQLELSPDGQWLAAADEYGLTVVWNLESASRDLWSINQDGESMLDIAFSADNKILVGGSSFWTVKLWDVSTGEPLQPPLAGHENLVWLVAISPDNRLIASADNLTAVILWNREINPPLGRPLLGHSEAVTALAFSPDGRRLATGDSGGTIILWDTATGQPLGRPFMGHATVISSLAFRAEGRQLLSASKDGQVIRWNLDFDAWKAIACRIADRQLTELEWEQYVGQVAAYAPVCEL